MWHDYALAESAYALATAAATWIAPIDSVADRVNGGSIKRAARKISDRDTLTDRTVDRLGKRRAC